jgi:hypothetical protein
MKDIDHPYPDLDYTCDKCGVKTGEPTEIREDYWVCDYCLDDFAECSVCKNWIEQDELIEVDGKFICENCYDENVVECPVCLKLTVKEDDENHLCSKCNKELEHLK